MPSVRGRVLASARRRGRAAWRRLQENAELRRRRIPSFEIEPPSGRPSVYYLLPAAATPQGGIRVGYRHVDELNALGWRAAVLHPRPEDRARWFEHDTRVVDYASARLREDDILVVPEWYGLGMTGMDPRLRTVVFNQGAYITYDRQPLSASGVGEPYRRIPRLEGIMTVSRDSAALLGLAFPEERIDIVRPVVDGEVFHPEGRVQERTLAFTTTRRGEERNLLQHLLRGMGVDWGFAPIAGMTERQVADRMRRSSIFLSFSERDGFGLPPAEAMACGAYVIGFTGGGGDEYFDASYSEPVSNIVDFAEAVHRAATAGEEALAAAGRAASAAILGRYTIEGLREDLTRVYTRLLGAPDSW